MNWMELLNNALSIIIPALATLLAGWFAIIGAKMKQAYDSKVKDETTKQVIDDVVKFVQQVYKDLDGQSKLQKAIEQASQILAGKGIEISETEINMLIESAVYGLKQGMTTLEALPENTETDSQEVIVDEADDEQN